MVPKCLPHSCSCFLCTQLSKHNKMLECCRARQSEEVEKQRPLRGPDPAAEGDRRGAGQRGRRRNGLHSHWFPELSFRVDILILAIPSSSSPSTYCLSSDFLPVPLAWPPPHPACCGQAAQRAPINPSVWGPGPGRGHLANRDGWRTWLYK